MAKDGEFSSLVSGNNTWDLWVLSNVDKKGRTLDLLVLFVTEHLGFVGIVSNVN